MSQACPLSPLLFAIAMELMAPCATTVRALRGLTMRETAFHDTEENLMGARDLLEEFGRLSGLGVNWQKSKLFPLARREQLTIEQRKPRCLTYLWVKIYHNRVNLLEDNVGCVIGTPRSFMNFWGALPLSVMGRIALLKTVALPRFLDIFTTLSRWIPGAQFRELKTLSRVYLGIRASESGIGHHAAPDSETRPRSL